MLPRPTAALTATAVFLMAASPAMAGEAVAARAPTLTILPSGDSSDVLALAVDDTGVVVGRSIRGRTTHGVIWLPDGRVKDLGAATTALAINDRHEVVGHGPGGPTIWRRTGVQALHGTEALGNNDVGLVAGSDDCVAAQWQRSGTETLLFAGLGRPGEVCDVATGVNRAGTFIGAATVRSPDATIVHLPWLKPAGQATVALPCPTSQGVAHAINGAGQVAGACYDDFEDPDRLAVRWTDGQADILPDRGEGSHAEAIDEAGDVVGRVLVGGQRHAALWQDGVLVDLQQALAAQVPAGWTLADAHGINHQGSIIVGEMVQAQTGIRAAWSLAWR